MKLKKLFLILSIVFTLCLFCGITANADTSGYYTYSVSNGEAIITDCDSTASGSISIPSTLGGYPVTIIGDSAFYNCDSITSISVPKSVSLINNSAFGDCDQLISITISSGVTKIGDSAFSNCDNLKYVYFLSDGITSIGKYAFSNCGKLASITIPKSVTIIDDYAFYYCESLAKVSFPESALTIGEKSFYGCKMLSSITLFNSTINIGKDTFKNTGYYNNSSNWTNGVLYISNHLVSAEKATGNVTVKSTTKTIANEAFLNCSNITSVTIPDSVTNIGDSVFSGCSSLTNITIGNGITKIGKKLFSNCTSLSSISIPNSVTSIGNNAFAGCTSLTNISIPNSVTSIGDYAFYSCNKLIGITIPNGVTSIGEYVFSNCGSLASINIPDSVLSIGYSAFSNCTSLKKVYASNIKAWCNIDFTDSTSNPLYNSAALYLNNIKADNIEISNDLTTIKKYTFYGCSNLTSITIPSSVTSIDSNAFSACISLKEINLSEGLKDIASHAFGGYSTYNVPTGITTVYGCNSLTHISLPSTVTNIDERAFSVCNNLTSITVDKNNLHYLSENNVLFNKDRTALVLYPLKKPGDAYTIPTGVTSISNYAFYDCDNLLTINIPDGVTSIGNHAFYSCSNLLTISIPDSVTSFGDYAFYSCKGLTSINIPDGITSIGAYAFSYCENFTSITIPKNVTNIGKNAFYACKGLTTINWNAKNVADYSSKNNVFSYAGQNGTGIEVTFGDEVESIPAYIFFPTTNTSVSPKITSITIGKSVTKIGNFAFGYCGNLTSITIPSSVTAINNYTFYECNNLADVYYSGSSDEWANVTIGQNNAPLSSATIHCTDECDILSILSPDSGILNVDDKTIAFKVANNITSITPEFELSYGATWGLYSDISSTVQLSKTVDLSREGRTYTRYIRVTAADGETTNTYTVTFYRNTKSISPVITFSRDKVTITAENCEIYYTTDGTTPTMESTKYTGVFSALSNATINAIAVETGKDEPSDVATASIPEYFTTTMTGIECFNNYDGTCDYMIMIQSDGNPNGEFIVAIYDIDGRLIGIKTEQKTVNLEDIISDTVEISGTPHTYKAFFWNSLEDLVPLCECINGNVE